MHLTKHHCLGNDFLVVLDELNGPTTIGPDDARRLCDRHRGVGADGLMHGSAPSPAPVAGGGAAGEPVDVVMRLFNADGSPAEMSGNGIRCFGQAVADARGLREGQLRVATDAGAKQLCIRPGTGPSETDIEAEIGVPGAGPDIPPAVARRLAGRRYATVDMGNPHLVIVVDRAPDLAELDLGRIGPELEQAFPAGINIEFVAVIDAAVIELRVWERGVGITEACGTGACAAASQLAAWGRVTDDVEVRMPGGSAQVRLRADGTVTLAGPTVRIASIEVADA